MFGTNRNVPNLTLANGAAAGGYADYVKDASEDAESLNQQHQAEERKALEQAEEKKKSESEKDTGVFSPLAGNSWSAAGAIANQAEQFLLLSPMYRFSAVA
jgi:hypothetical protein